jgi:hypothetical protein
LPIDPSLDHLFARERFRDTSFELVKSRWSNKSRNVRWVRGYFPNSAGDIEISNVSFAHVDLDLYESTVNTLEYLRPRLIEQSIVVFDDYLRGVDGVIKATREFSEAHPDWVIFPSRRRLGRGAEIARLWRLNVRLRMWSTPRSPPPISLSSGRPWGSPQLRTMQCR